MSHNLNAILWRHSNAERCSSETSRAQSTEQTLTTGSACYQNPWKWLHFPFNAFCFFLDQITLLVQRAPPLSPRVQQLCQVFHDTRSSKRWRLRSTPYFLAYFFPSQKCLLCLTARSLALASSLCAYCTELCRTCLQKCCRVLATTSMLTDVTCVQWRKSLRNFFTFYHRTQKQN